MRDVAPAETDGRMPDIMIQMHALKRNPFSRHWIGSAIPYLRKHFEKYQQTEQETTGNTSTELREDLDREEGLCRRGLLDCHDVQE